MGETNASLARLWCQCLWSNSKKIDVSFIRTGFGLNWFGQLTFYCIYNFYLFIYKFCGKNKSPKIHHNYDKKIENAQRSKNKHSLYNKCRKYIKILISLYIHWSIVSSLVLFVVYFRQSGGLPNSDLNLTNIQCVHSQKHKINILCALSSNERGSRGRAAARKGSAYSTI